MDGLELEKIKYHQRLLIHIATNVYSDKTLFFQNVIVFDLSEEQVKIILQAIMQGELNSLIQYIDNESIKYSVENILNDCINQDICIENCKKMQLTYKKRYLNK